MISHQCVGIMNALHVGEGAGKLMDLKPRGLRPRANLHAHQINEHDLDMRRDAGSPAGQFGSSLANLVGRVAGALAALAPGSRPIGRPMRSVERELEESWPHGRFDQG